MSDVPDETSALRSQIADLSARLEEATETLDAIRNGEVDAVVVGSSGGQQIYTLETADRHYRMLIEQISDGAVMLSPEGAVLYSNLALSTMLDLPISHLVGAKFAPFVGAASLSIFERLLKHGGRAQLHLHRATDDSRFTVQMSLVELTTGDTPLLCGVVTDLTQTLAAAREMAETRSRLAVEAARHESDERYRLILESATDYAILAIGLHGRVTTWNTGAQNILGWSADEVIGAAMPMIWTQEDLQNNVQEHDLATARERGRAETERWYVRKDGSQFWANGLSMPLMNGDGAVIGFLQILQDRTQKRQAELNQLILINELNHRVKNTLSTVQSIVTLTLRDAPSPAQARQALEDRLMALSRAHDVLTRESWESAELSEIVSQAVEAYQTPEAPRIHMSGAPVRLSPRLALATAMALQELTTNAVKYGALSNLEGHVDIRWTANATTLDMVWQERGGPTVKPPSRRGFGSRLIERALAADFRGSTKLEFEPTGVVCVINAQLSEDLISD